MRPGGTTTMSAAEQRGMRPACSVDCGQAQRLRRQQARTVEIARHFRRDRLPRRNMWRDSAEGMMVSDAWTGEQSLHVACVPLQHGSDPGLHWGGCKYCTSFVATQTNRS